MLVEDLNWRDVERYLEQDDRIILVTGACEQHAYLSLLADVREPMAIATAAAEREHVLVAPPLNYGVSSYFNAYPGTIGLSVETHNRVIGEIVTDLHRQGFKRVLVLNGHLDGRLLDGASFAPLRLVLVESRFDPRDVRHSGGYYGRSISTRPRRDIPNAHARSSDYGQGAQSDWPVLASHQGG